MVRKLSRIASHGSWRTVTDADELGVISGITGASGTLGGVIFTVINSHTEMDYPKLLRIIGVWTLAAQLVTFWVSPISKKQLGGR